MSATPPRRWTCPVPGCGYTFDPGPALAQLAAGAAQMAAAGAAVAGPPMLLCGTCHTMMAVADDLTGVRPLTAAERFELEFDCPAGMAAAAAGLLTPRTDEPTLYALPVE